MFTKDKSQLRGFETKYYLVYQTHTSSLPWGFSDHIKIYRKSNFPKLTSGAEAKEYHYDLKKLTDTIYENIVKQYPVLNEVKTSSDEINLSIDETMRNAELHGNKIEGLMDLTTPTLMKYNVVEESDKVNYKLSVKDHGAGFDHKNLKEEFKIAEQSGDFLYGAKTYEDVKFMPSQHLGLFVLLRLMDKVDWNEKGNEITLEKTFFKKTEKKR